MKKLLTSTISSLRYLFVTSKTLPFVGALVVSYKYVEITVVYSLMYYLMDSRNHYNLDQRLAAVVTNLYNGLSSILFVIVSLFSEAYTGCFTMIAFCAAASIEGLMLLWTSTSSASANRAIYGGIFLLALGNSGQKLSENFLQYQLQEKIKSKKEQDHVDTNTDTIRINIWFIAPSIVGYIITIHLAFTVDDKTYSEMFRFAALLIGGTFILFLFAYVWYRHEKLPAESNLHKIYRICKAGLWKRKLKYPTTADSYYWKDYKQDHYLYPLGNGQRLLPRVPRLFRWLDKAAIVNAEEASPETQEKNGKLCMVKEVREVKSLVPMIYLCFAFFAYSLLMASGNTFFVAQASGMKSVITSNNNDITSNNNDIWILFLIADSMNKMSQFFCFIISFAFRCFEKSKGMAYGRSKRKAGRITRIGFGMVCAVICSLIAWRVEVRRLSIINDKNGDTKQGGGNTTVALVPQFLLLGMTEGLVDGGLGSLFRGNVAKSMWSFEDSFVGLVFGIGKLLIIPLIFSSWVKKTVDKSRLDRLYLMLGILNGVFLLGFGYYSIRYAYGEECQEAEKVTVEGRLERVHHQPDSEDSPYPENSNKKKPVDQEMSRFYGKPSEDSDEIVAASIQDDDASWSMAV